MVAACMRLFGARHSRCSPCSPSPSKIHRARLSCGMPRVRYDAIGRVATVALRLLNERVGLPLGNLSADQLILGLTSVLESQGVLLETMRLQRYARWLVLRWLGLAGALTHRGCV